MRRLLARLAPERARLVIVLFLGVTSVAFLVSGPEDPRRRDHVLFNGIVSQSAGLTPRRRLSRRCGRTGQGQLAGIIPGMNITPGAGSTLPDSARSSA